ncbi:MAG: DNA polymerase I [Methylophilaceae bacterium]|jgi:DNA polymerase-1|nr:DNA polymerase I [Methylophilaceae bacterium]MBL6728661.1 DNA polymerase I [Methylophilaceae bacterium]MBL6791447.1 DNA polymerase I [Methylophilaceae bacterium]
MKKLLLIDGSSYLYRAFHAMPDFRNKSNEPTGVIYGVLNMLRHIQNAYPSDYSVCVFDAKGKTFRNEIFQEYKATRPKMPEELASQIVPLKEAIKAMGWFMITHDGVEADDVIGTLSKKANAENISVTISTGDKDLAQLVNKKTKLVNTMTNEVLDEDGVKKKFGVAAEQIIDYLTIIGDKVDNIPGVEKVGPKTAVKWLDEFGSLEKIISNAEKFNGVIGENLRLAMGWLPTGKQLITIKTDIKLDYKWDDFEKKPTDIEKLYNLYKKFNFTSWLKELDAQSSQNNKIADKSNNSHPNKTKFLNKKNYTLVTNFKDLESWVEKIINKKFFCIDTETDSLNFMDANLVGISIAIDMGDAIYIPLQHTDLSFSQLSIQETLALLKPILEDASINKIGQNIKFDTHIFKNYGIDLNGISDDTMLMSYVIESHQSHGMDKLSKKYLDHDCISYESMVGKGVNQITFDQVNINNAKNYAAEDADVTLQLFNHFKKLLQEEEKLPFIYNEIEIPAMKALIDIERNGVLIDEKILHQQSHAIGEKLIQLEKKAFDLAGQPFNLSSPKQLQEILFEKLGIKPIKKTPKGAPSTGEEVLQELAENYPLPKIILEHRGLAKLKSTYTDKLPRMINTKTGRVHTSYNQAVAITGRLASSDPNLQNIPIRTEDGRRVREAFVANTKNKILSADYSQIELRIMAHLSGDEGLIAAFRNNEDIHKATASDIFSCGLQDVTQEQRRYAKVINFGLIYGMGVYGLAKNLNIERSAAQSYIEKYFSKYPKVRNYMEDAKSFAKQYGYVETLFGRRLWTPEINGSNGMRRAAAERAAINGPMQGTAADLIKLAMIKIHDWILQNKNLKGLMIMQVHDELVFEVPEEEIVIFKKTIKDLMENVAELNVPLIVDIGEGNNWEQAH